MTTPELGAHIDQADPAVAASERACDIVQIFLGDPQDWKGPVVNYPGGTAALRAAAESAGVGVYVHAPYVMNVATTNNRIRIPSRKLLQQTVDAAAEVGARGVIVHGGHVNRSDDPETGFDNWRKCVERLELRCPIFIENTAGGDNAMARRMDRIGRLWDAVSSADGSDNVGFCLDTCHAHAGGEELATVADRVKAITGRIDLVHLNNSRDEFDSGRDRHANLEAGTIAGEDLVAVIRAAGAPVIIETPGGVGEHTEDLGWLRSQLS